MELEFSSGDIISRKNYVDLLEDGEFIATSLELYGEPDEVVSGFTAWGRWYHDSIVVPGVLRVTELEWNIPAPTYRDVLEGKVTAGDIFKGAGWYDWTVEDYA